jgi:hypothetical protein
MKKFILVLVAAASVLTLAACSENLVEAPEEAAELDYEHEPIIRFLAPSSEEETFLQPEQPEEIAGRPDHEADGNKVLTEPNELPLINADGVVPASAGGGGFYRDSADDDSLGEPDNYAPRGGGAPGLAPAPSPGPEIIYADSANLIAVEKGNVVEFIVDRNCHVYGVFELVFSGGLTAVVKSDNILFSYYPVSNRLAFTGLHLLEGDVLFSITFTGAGNWLLVDLIGEENTFGSVYFTGSITELTEGYNPLPPPVTIGNGSLIAPGAWNLGAVDERGFRSDYWYIGELQIDANIKSTLTIDIFKRATKIAFEFPEDVRGLNSLTFNYFFKNPSHGFYSWINENISYNSGSAAASFSEDGRIITLDLNMLSGWNEIGDRNEQKGFIISIGTTSWAELHAHRNLISATLYFEE